MRAAMKGSGRTATLIAPANHAWEEAGQPVESGSFPMPETPSESAIKEAVAALTNGTPTALLRGGNPSEARIEYTAALALDDRLVAAYVGRALAYAEQWDFAGAQADLDSALAVAPHDPVALNGQAQFYAWYRHDHLDEAERLAQRAIAGAEGDFERARYLHTLGWTYFGGHAGAGRRAGHRRGTGGVRGDSGTPGADPGAAVGVCGTQILADSRTSGQEGRPDDRWQRP